MPETTEEKWKTYCKAPTYTKEQAIKMFEDIKEHCGKTPCKICHFNIKSVSGSTACILNIREPREWYPDNLASRLIEAKGK